MLTVEEDMGRCRNIRFWGKLSRRVNMSRKYTKNCVYLLLYAGKIDPWLDHIVLYELKELRSWDDERK